MLLKYSLLIEQCLCLGGHGHLPYICDNTFAFSRVLMGNTVEHRTVAAWLCSEVLTWLHKRTLCKQVQSAHLCHFQKSWEKCEFQSYVKQIDSKSWLISTALLICIVLRNVAVDKVEGT